MNAAAMRASYRRQFLRRGETVILRRINASPATPTDASVLARIVGLTPEELAAGITQGMRKVLVLAEDVESEGFPTPIKTGGSDKIVVRGHVLNIEAVDDNTRRLGETLIAYELTVLG